MKRFLLKLELLEDTIFTARSATVGAPQSLDYVPGATLYGACAAKLYSSLNVADQFAVFHSGNVRFGNGLPCDRAGDTALPMPLCWHVKKGTDPYLGKDKKKLDGSLIYNRLTGVEMGDNQPKQLRQGYVNAFGELYQPTATFRMKTAINPFTETAAEAQLFGYAAVQAGQRFNATLEIDEDRLAPAQANQLVDQVVEAMGGRLRLGRSRSAQYGTVECTVSEQSVESQEDNDVSHGLVLWLLSDAALRDGYGQPTLTVSSYALGLDTSLTVNWQKTFIRTRQYSPYNAKRGCHDQERQVLVQGSIICFDPPLDSLPSVDMNRLNRGIGDYLHSGLGKVMVQPNLLKHEHPEFEKRVDNSAVATSPLPPMPDTDLMSWLHSMVSHTQRQDETREDALMLLEKLKELYQSAQAFVAVDENTFIGPGKSQWSRVAALARSASGDKLKSGLCKIVGQSENDGTVTITDEDWAVETGLSLPLENFGQWLVHQFVEKETSARVLLILATYAIDLVDDLQFGTFTSDTSMEVADA